MSIIRWSPGIICTVVSTGSTLIMAGEVKFCSSASSRSQGSHSHQGEALGVNDRGVIHASGTCRVSYQAVSPTNGLGTRLQKPQSVCVCVCVCVLGGEGFGHTAHNTHTEFTEGRFFSKSDSACSLVS